MYTLVSVLCTPEHPTPSLLASDFPLKVVKMV